SEARRFARGADRIGSPSGPTRPLPPIGGRSIAMSFREEAAASLTSYRVVQSRWGRRVGSIPRDPGGGGSLPPPRRAPHGTGGGQIFANQSSKWHGARGARVGSQPLRSLRLAGDSVIPGIFYAPGLRIPRR